MAKSRIGLLPLYIELYDQIVPKDRPIIEEFVCTIEKELTARNIDVVKAPICRIHEEFDSAVKEIEKANVDAIVTLHLAYSPSLESIDALAGTDLPLIILDTTRTYSFGPSQSPSEIMYNHGIHGVQDLCNLLRRRGKSFQIEAGHWQKSDVLDRVAQWAWAARLVSKMRNARIGKIGEAFKGMGDFSVPTDTLKSTIGMDVVECDWAELRSLIPPADDPSVKAEMDDDKARFEIEDVPEDAHIYTSQTSVAVRRWMEKHNLTGFTMNFGAFDESTGIPTVPFLIASKTLASGQGYAGEGDVLTAALVSTLLSEYPDTTFTEIFCPDWEGNTILLSHMGEFNLNLADSKPLLTLREISYINVDNPVIAYGRFRGGEACLVNLAPGPCDTYTLIIAPVHMMDVNNDQMPKSVRGWLKPELPIADFLADYSFVGGTHHSALVYGDVADDMARFGEMMGWNVVALVASEH